MFNPALLSATSGSWDRTNTCYRVTWVQMEIDERKRQNNASKITKWILYIINSDNWFYCFGKLLWQSATKCLTWFKFQNTFVSKLLESIFLINEVDLIWISNAQRGKEEQKQKEDARKRVSKRGSALRITLLFTERSKSKQPHSTSIGKLIKDQSLSSFSVGGYHLIVL